MIDSKTLLNDLKKQVTALEDDLRNRCDAEPEVDGPLKARYDEAKAKKRTAMTYKAWRDGELTQVAVAWVLGCVFVRFLEDNELVETPKLAGPGERLQRARDEHEMYFRRQPEDNTERGYLTEIFTEVGQLPAMKEFFDARHNPLWLAAPSGDGCRALWQFWQKTNPETGELEHDFTDPDWNTRFLGDLYQDLSEAVRKRYALLQTPVFVEEFILDRTLTPAIDTFGFQEVRLIDPTCGSGHFLLGALSRLLRIWQTEKPEEKTTVLAQHALDGVYGVDLNPYAVSIARFRLLLAALQFCETKRLKDAWDFKLNLAVGDSLLHGARFRAGQAQRDVQQQTFGGDEELFKDELAHFFDAEDSAELHRILGQQYHAVVGNPPYITVKDKALNQLYRKRYDACHRQYALSVPFMERFFDLSLTGSDDRRGQAGFTGQITSNSFMKREFGKKLIEEQILRWDLTHVIDTSGAYIPGHGTPTVILFGRNSKPTAPTVRTVMGIRGEPGTPVDPAAGKVWCAIIDKVDSPGMEDDFVSVEDTERRVIESHPWILNKLARRMSDEFPLKLNGLVTEIGFGAVTRLDDAYELGKDTLLRAGIAGSQIRELVTGDDVRDWQIDGATEALWPYDKDSLKSAGDNEVLTTLWPFRRDLSRRVAYGKSQIDRGLEWFEYSMFFEKRFRRPLTISFACVATHNQFVFERDQKLFNRHAPVIKLPEDATEDQHLHLLGLLNSSSACFWMKQVFHCKGSTVDSRGARQTTVPFEDFYEFDGTKLKQFPVTKCMPLALVRSIDRLAQELSSLAPGEVVAGATFDTAALAEAEQESILIRSRLISLQEELDWLCYRMYGLIDANDNLEWAEDRIDEIPHLNLGERAFEISMSRQIESGEFETTWFVRHRDAGSRSSVDLPFHWPGDYQALVERRVKFIEANKNINLIERPEFKRRWNNGPWVKRQQEALRKWLLARLEGYFFEGSRVSDLKETFDPAAHGFGASARPQLVTANQLADVVQSDAKFMEAAEVYEGAGGFSVSKLIRTLIDSENVPFLPVLRYKPTGLRYRRDWEATWELQRKEDQVEAELRKERTQGGRELTKVEEELLKEQIRHAQQAQVGDIPVPPKYGSKDFLKSSYWKLRGKLDVPKERWISYPGAERSGDDSLVIAWAGWDHLQQAQALAEYFIDAKENQGWPVERLKPLLAGLSDLIPWLKQWHNEHDQDLGMGMGEYFTGFLAEQCRALDLTVEEVDEARFVAGDNN